MFSKTNNIEAVDVYLERKKTRAYVGRLTHIDSKYVFNYDDKYLCNASSLALGPDLPLSKKTFNSSDLFTSFEDRIPSKNNPAYQEYCEMVGIRISEDNKLVLVATLGQKGPSSFIFTPVFKEHFSSKEVIQFRRDLKLSVREFSSVFDFSAATIHRIENNKTSGKDALKRLEIYYYFPEVALFELEKNGHKINDEARKYVKDVLASKNKPQ